MDEEEKSKNEMLFGAIAFGDEEVAKFLLLENKNKQFKKVSFRTVFLLLSFSLLSSPLFSF